MLTRQYYLILSALGIASLIILPQYWSAYYWTALIIIPYIVIGFYDLFVSRSNVLRNYPVIGHLRYGLEFISPEIRQYFVETEHSGRPFNREQRVLVYRRSEGRPDFQPFGTQFDVSTVGYETAAHSLNPKEVPEEEGRTFVGGPECKKPYNASRLNISAMSFGALSPNAIEALNSGAQLGNFAHNTGEGGLSRYHLAGGGDIFWQIGTGYFGCRTKDGHFDPAQFAERAQTDAVKMIEIKLSQGAKPSHGGVLPGAKVDREFADVRGVPGGGGGVARPSRSTLGS